MSSPKMSDHDEYTGLLSEHVDGALDDAERENLLAHLESCAECRTLLEDLRALRREARLLPSPEPPEAVWDAVSRAVRGSRRPGAARTFLPYLALAAALVLGVGLWVGVREAGRPPTNDPEALVDRITEELRAADAHYTNAIDGLEQIIAQNDGVLPTELRTTLNVNLDLIEQAIEDSRTAMQTEPGSTAAQESLLTALRRKVSLLQSTILLINEIRKGEGENARDLIDEMRQSSDPANPI